MKRILGILLVILFLAVALPFGNTSLASTADTFYSTSADGDTISTDVVYATAWDMEDAEYIIDDAISVDVGQLNTYQIWRTCLYFDTSAIPDGVTIISASLNLYGYPNSDRSDTDFLVVVQNGQPTYPHDPIEVGDHNRDNYSGDGGSLTTVGWDEAGYNVIDLNEDGISWITKSGTTKFMLRSSRDIAGTTPTEWERVGFKANEETGTDKDPYLYVEWNDSPTVETDACSDATSTSFQANGDITDAGGTVTTRGFYYTTVYDGFEWGEDEDPLDDDGGAIDWTITAEGDSKAEIDTAQNYTGTRSARLYVEGDTSGWVSPTGHNDFDTWFYEDRAYDDDTGTFAITATPDGELELTIGAITCDKIRLYARDLTGLTPSNPTVTISVYYDSAYHEIFSGAITHSTWVEKAIGSTETVTKAKISGTIAGADFLDLYEFEFYSVQAPSLPAAWFTQSPLTSSQSISFRFRKDADSVLRIDHGDGTTEALVRIYNDEKIYYYDTEYRDTGTTVSIDQWYILELKNFDWDADTYDIYLDGVLVEADTSMRTNAAGDNVVVFYNSGAASSVWLDNVGVWEVEDEDGSFGEGEYDLEISGLDSITTYYVMAFAENEAGIGYGDIAEGLTCPAAPTDVVATDGDHTDKVVVTWTKSTGATGYNVYEGDNLLDTLGDVAAYDDTSAPAPTINPGDTVAADGDSTAHVALSLSGTVANNGTSRTYKVVAFNDAGDSPDSDTDTGYRGVGGLTYQWQRSSGDADEDYSNIDGATDSTYNDVDAPAPTITPGSTVATDGDSTAHIALSLSGALANEGAGRYYQCILNAEGAAQQISASNRGNRGVGALNYQWQRSSGDADADYSNIDGATASTYNDEDAPAPSVTAGNATASDGTSAVHVTLTVNNHTANNGAGRYYQCILSAEGAGGQTAAFNRGYRGAGDLTYQWHRSSGDSDADYSVIGGGTTSPYNDTDGVFEPDGRYYLCTVNMTGAVSQNSTTDRGYKLVIVAPNVTAHDTTGITGMSGILHSEIIDTGNENPDTVGFEWGYSAGNYSHNWTDMGDFGLDVFSHTISGFSMNTTVFWRGFAINSGGTGYSAAMNFTTLALPLAPTNFTITQIGYNSYNISWTMGTAASTTIVRASETGYPDGVTGGYPIYSGNSTWVIVTGLDPNMTTYYYRAWSENDYGYSLDYAEAILENPLGIAQLLFPLGLFGFALWKRGWIRAILSLCVIMWGAFAMPYDVKIAAPLVAVGTILFVISILNIIKGGDKWSSEIPSVYRR